MPFGDQSTMSNADLYELPNGTILGDTFTAPFPRPHQYMDSNGNPMSDWACEQLYGNHSGNSADIDSESNGQRYGMTGTESVGRRSMQGCKAYARNAQNRYNGYSR
jgi:hypothetical protein